MLHLSLHVIVALFAALAPADDEAKYTQAINKRADEIIATLGIADSPKSKVVHEVLVSQYRALRDWHDANDTRLKGSDTAQVAAIRQTLVPIHDHFLAKLSNDLTPEQVEMVKDKMTYGKVKVTYDAYVEIVQTLTPSQKTRILEWLKEAREEAMDGGSAEEKSAIFKKYKGRINNYLSTEGIDMKQKTKEWGARQKAKKDVLPATQPGN